MGGIKSVGVGAVQEIVRARSEGGPFKDLADFCNRVSMRIVNKRVVENLIRSGAMDSFKANRAQLLSVMDTAIEQGSAYQKDAESGQMGLFDDTDVFQVTEIRLPDMEELPKSIMLQQEKELLGFYVSGHPLSAYEKVLRSYTPLYQFIGDNCTLADGTYVKVAGIISECSLRNTKKGDTMATLVLEDFTGRFPVIVFPQAFQKSIRDIYKDGVVAVEGRYSVDERERKVIAARVYPLKADEQIQSSKVVVHVKIDAYLENNLVQRELMRVFKNHKGNDMVLLYLMGSRKTIKTSQDFWVDSASDGFVEEIERILGKESVKLAEK